MGIQPPSNFGSHRYCCSGDMVVYLVVEGQDLGLRGKMLAKFRV